MKLSEQETIIPKVIEKHQAGSRLMLLALAGFSFIFLIIGIALGVRFTLQNRAVSQASQVFKEENKAEEINILKPTASPLIQPTVLAIPSLNITAPIVNVGLTIQQELQVPANDTEVGWYEYGPAPGQSGPAVLVGHLDSAHGPSVFYRLKKISQGDTISITRKDGSTVHFQVDEVEAYNQDNFPTSKVYGDIPYAGLRLITCAGTFDRQKLRYTENLVVFASMR
jgi:LPXTG-site transpeptidase (sortase) family protein